MNITTSAHRAIIDAALRAGESHPLVRISITFPPGGQRLISTSFIKDYCVDSQKDRLENHDGLSLVMDPTSSQALEGAVLDAKYGRFDIKWPSEDKNEIHRKSKRKNRRNRR